MAEGSADIHLLLLVTFSAMSVFLPDASAQLSTSFYTTTCPSVFFTVRSVVQFAVNREPRMGASLLRLHFHDCFVNGCDGSILLDDTGTFVGEKTAAPNNNSVRGFEVIDSIKSMVDRRCGPGIVSCADIVAIAARDSVFALGGPAYPVPVGRRDATTASMDAANTALPSPFGDLDAITSKFTDQGFTQKEMVTLSGAHTIGFAHCRLFRGRIYNETNIEQRYAARRRVGCPAAAGSGDDILGPLDEQSPNRFGNNYFTELTRDMGLLHSDQVLFNGGPTDSVVTTYSNDGNAFAVDFASVMVKMGNLNPLTGTAGEVRLKCRKVN